MLFRVQFLGSTWHTKPLVLKVFKVHFAMPSGRNLGWINIASICPGLAMEPPNTYRWTTPGPITVIHWRILPRPWGEAGDIPKWNLFSARHTRRVMGR